MSIHLFIQMNSYELIGNYRQRDFSRPKDVGNSHVNLKGPQSGRIKYDMNLREIRDYNKRDNISENIRKKQHVNISYQMLERARELDLEEKNRNEIVIFFIFYFLDVRQDYADAIKKNA